MASTQTAKFFTVAKDLSATSGGASADVIYTCPNHFISLIKFMQISSGANSVSNYSIQWYENDTTTYHFLIDNHSIAGNSVEDIIAGGAYIALRPGDKIVGFADAGSDFHVTISGEEHYQPTSF